ncbi:MAG TPA: DUF998 domain-containing protein [Pseudonocardia sp.]
MPGTPSRARPGGSLAGGVCWVLAAVQYAVAQMVAAAAWQRPYSLRRNYLSDLGNTRCGWFAVAPSTPTYVCSPLHAVMNASFVTAGVLVVAGAVLQRPTWPPGGTATAAGALWVLDGLGRITVGLVPENTNIGVHLLGALNIPVGSIATLLTAVALRRSRPGLGLAGVALGVLGLTATVLTGVAQHVDSEFYLGLGVGGLERAAEYPATLWILLAGLAAASGGSRRLRPSG